MKLEIDQSQSICQRIANKLAIRSNDVIEIEMHLTSWSRKTVSEDVDRAIDTLRNSTHLYDLAAADAQSFTGPTSLQAQTLIQPAGAVLAIVPETFTSVIMARKIGPAICCGNDVVIGLPKTFKKYAQIWQEIFDSVLASNTTQTLNAVSEAGPVYSRWIREGRFDRVSFTGSTLIGREVAEACTETLTPSVLELGGDAHLLALPGTEIEQLVNNISSYKSLAGGQSCNGPNRVFLHENDIEAFRKSVTAKVIDNNWLEKWLHDDGIARNERRCHYQTLVEYAVQQGAHIVRLIRPNSVNNAFGVVFVFNEGNNCPFLKEELFGPIVEVSTYKDPKEVITTINKSQYGLSAYLFGELSVAISLAKRLKVARVVFNKIRGVSPNISTVGLRDSGWGAEGGINGVKFFMDTLTLENVENNGRA